MKLIKKITEAAFQRNRICGEPFYVIRFIMAEGNKPAQAILFDSPDCYCAVTTQDLGEHWRGDNFSDELRAFIASDLCKQMCWPDQYPARPKLTLV